MTRRVVAVLAQPSPAAAPPGVDAAAFAHALLEDVVDLVAGMQQVEPALVVVAGYDAAARDVAWPGMPLLSVAHPDDVVAALDALAALGADEGAVVAGDAPDLPPLLIGKLHSALTAAEVAVCPADRGGLVALAARLPVAGWLRAAPVGLDAADAVSALRAAAPARGLHVGPGWHRLRRPEDVARLDPGLEGWEATRALLGG